MFFIQLRIFRQQYTGNHFFENVQKKYHYVKKRSDNFSDALGRNRTCISSFGGLRAIRCTTSANLLRLTYYMPVSLILQVKNWFKKDKNGYAE